MSRNSELEVRESAFDLIVGQPLRREVNGKIEERCGPNGRTLDHQDLLRGIGLFRLLGNIERNLVKSGVNGNVLGAITRLKTRVGEQQELIWNRLGGDNLHVAVQKDVDRMRDIYPHEAPIKSFSVRRQ